VDFVKYAGLDINGYLSGLLRDKIQEKFTGVCPLGARVYDPSIVSQDVRQKVEAICHANNFFPGNKFTVDHTEDIDGGLPVFIQMDWGHRLQLDFSYQGMNGQTAVFNLKRVEGSQYNAQYKRFEAMFLDEKVGTALMSAAYRVNLGDHIQGPKASAL